MKLSEERRVWLREQLKEFKECHLMNFGDSRGWDVHGDLCDLLDDNAQLEDDIKKIEINTDAYADENKALKDAVLDLYKSKDGTIKESTYIFAEKLYGDALLKESE